MATDDEVSPCQLASAQLTRRVPGRVQISVVDTEREALLVRLKGHEGSVKTVSGCPGQNGERTAEVGYGRSMGWQKYGMAEVWNGRSMG